MLNLRRIILKPWATEQTQLLPQDFRLLASPILCYWRWWYCFGSAHHKPVKSQILITLLWYRQKYIENSVNMKKKISLGKLKLMIPPDFLLPVWVSYNIVFVLMNLFSTNRVTQLACTYRLKFNVTTDLVLRKPGPN